MQNDDEELFNKQQITICEDICSLLIVLIPEAGSSFYLELKNAPEGVKHFIFSEKQHQEAFSIPIELFDETLRLVALLKQYDRQWHKAKLHIYRLLDGKWNFTITYQ